MKTINVRELRTAMPHLRETLASEHELLLVSNGEPVARILPIPPRRHVTSLVAHRARMTALPASIEQILREDRDRR